MATILKRQKDGVTWRPNWYGIFRLDGKSHVFNTQGAWEGTPPQTLREKGDPDFEASRKVADSVVVERERDARQKGKATHLVERLIEIKTGAQVKYHRLADLPGLWAGLDDGGGSDGGEKWRKWCVTVFRRFADAIPCEHLHEVKPEQVAEYLRSLRRRFSPKTTNSVETVLRAAFARFLPHGCRSPFDGGKPKRSRRGGDSIRMIHRRPFTPAELSQLIDAARPDPFLFPLIVTAACTGMRRGDVCRLKWESVDLAGNALTVETAKTGATVDMPIFPPLRAVLEAALAERRKGQAYVFPDAARMQEENTDGLTWRFKKLIASALPDPVEETDATALPCPPAVRVSLADVLPQVRQAVERNIQGEKRDRVLETLRRYAAGQSFRNIAKEVSWTKTSISLYLHEAQDLSGYHFLPDRAASRPASKTKARIDRLTLAGSTEGRQRRASVLDWHALRVTWVTLALSAGVPMEIVRKVTGHATVDVVLRHYFKPGRADMRQALGDRMPDVLTGGKPKQLAASDDLAALAAKVGAGTATDAERMQLKALVAAL